MECETEISLAHKYTHARSEESHGHGSFRNENFASWLLWDVERMPVSSILCMHIFFFVLSGLVEVRGNVCFYFNYPFCDGKKPAQSNIFAVQRIHTTRWTITWKFCISARNVAAAATQLHWNTLHLIRTCFHRLQNTEPKSERDQCIAHNWPLWRLTTKSSVFASIQESMTDSARLWCKR